MKILLLSTITAITIIISLTLYFEQPRTYRGTIIIKNSNYQSDTIICNYYNTLYIKNNNLLDQNNKILYLNLISYRILNKIPI